MENYTFDPDLEEEVDALFEEYDKRFFEIWHRIADSVIDTPQTSDETYDTGGIV